MSEFQVKARPKHLPLVQKTALRLGRLQGFSYGNLATLFAVGVEAARMNCKSLPPAPADGSFPHEGQSKLRELVANDLGLPLAGNLDLVGVIVTASCEWLADRIAEVEKVNGRLGRRQLLREELAA